ncbi:MAG: YncE family protein [Planctomycetota bacterium]
MLTAALALFSLSSPPPPPPRPGGAVEVAAVSPVAVRPPAGHEVWACNRDNGSVSVLDTLTGTITHEIEVGVWPRSVAFDPSGALAFVANQRGNVPVDAHFATPFTGGELRGTISVIDAATKDVLATLTDVGVEPYGLAVAPAGDWLAVTAQRSASVRVLSTSAPFATLASFDFPASMSQLSGGTISDVDTDGDLVADLAQPRSLAIRDDAGDVDLFVAHAVSGWVSVLDVTLDGGGTPTGLALGATIDLDNYTPHPIFSPTPVQTIESQGEPRFPGEIALSPDGTRLLLPHLLHNTNHDLEFDFGAALPGDYANRVYPALSLVDAAARSFGGVDNSGRLEHELSDPMAPAEFVPYGGKGAEVAGGVYTLGGEGAPVLGGTLSLRVTGAAPGDVALIALGQPTALPLGPLGTLLVDGTGGVFATTPQLTLTAPLPGDPQFEGVSLFVQGALLGLSGLQGFTNGLEVVLGSEGYGAGELGRRAGHPGAVRYNAAGDRALLLNRGSEDVFLYSVNGSELSLLAAFPPRHEHVERAPLDASTPLGDTPLGFAVVPDASTSNDDARVYVVNETSRTLSTLWVDFEAGVIAQQAPQVGTLLEPDELTLSERLGQELFEDASRAQTAGGFNNSCASCHFEGGADANAWPDPSGPRATPALAGGSQLTGTLLWKGVRLNLGETGPKFAAFNGGTGVFTADEQQALIDHHRLLPVPLNPSLDPTGGLTAQAAFGRDLFFGSNETGLNPALRSAGCASCHPDADDFTLEALGYTVDVLAPVLTDDPAGLETVDPLCFSLQENLLAQNLRNVNSGVNLDTDDDGVPDLDRNQDGYPDVETYAPLFPDLQVDFTRDDTNGYLCPLGGSAGSPLKVFTRNEAIFGVPTLLGAAGSAPYFHDGAASSLRAVLDPEAQLADPLYGDPSYPGLVKHFNEFHDVRGHEDLVSGVSKVQATLQTAGSGSTIAIDLEALLAFVSSL